MRQNGRAANAASSTGYDLTIGDARIRMSPAASRLYDQIIGHKAITLPSDPADQYLAAFAAASVLFSQQTKAWRARCAALEREKAALELKLDVAQNSLREAALETVVERDKRGLITRTGKVPRG